MAAVEFPSAAELIRGLAGNHHTGMCLCPAHDDRTPSLHVEGGASGKVLFKCFAGCSQDAVLDALRRQLIWPDRGDRNSHALVSIKRPVGSASELDKEEDEEKRFTEAIRLLRAAVSAKGKPTDYLKSRGIEIVPSGAMILPATDSARLTGRRFPAMVMPIVSDRGGYRIQGAHVTFLTTDGGQNLEGKGGRIRRMYGHADGGFAVLGESDPDRPLLVGEGIETVLSAMQLTGLPGVAALSAGNLPKIQLPPCSEVIIAADNDPPGRDAAEALAKRLAAGGGLVRIAWPPREGDDWNDALQSGADPGELRRSLLEARTVEAPRGAMAFPMADFMEIEAPKHEFLLRPWLTTRCTGMIHAERGAGKTWFGLSVAYSVASGRPLLGWAVEHPACVLYIDGELPVRRVQERLGMLGPPTPNLFILSREQLAQSNITVPDLASPEGRDFFDTAIERYKPELIFLDPLSALVRSGAENEAEAWAPVQDWALKHRFRGRAIIFLHHEGRSGKPRGTSKREDLLDIAIGLKRKDDLSQEGESVFELTYTKPRYIYGADAAPRLLRLSTATGTVKWSQEPLKESTKEKVAELLRAGVTKQTAIAETLRVSKGLVSRYVGELKEKPSLLSRP